MASPLLMPANEPTPKNFADLYELAPLDSLDVLIAECESINLI